MASRQQARHKELFDQRCRGAELEVGDLVLVGKTAWKVEDLPSPEEEEDEEDEMPWVTRATQV